MLSATLYPYALSLAGVTFIALAPIFWALARPERLNFWEKLPRGVLPGTVLAALVLLWIVPHAEPVFYFGARNWMYPLALGLTVMVYFFLDYHFARALAGFLILLCHYLLQESFAARTPYGALFALSVFILGTAGIFVGGMPYLLRDFFRKICRDARWRTGVTAACAAYGVLWTSLGVATFIRS